MYHKLEGEGCQIRSSCRKVGKLLPVDVVLVDRGFNIMELVGQFQAKVQSLRKSTA